MNKQIKQNINFLEYPLWFQDERMAEQQKDGYTWRDREGFVYRMGYKPPVKMDRLFLLYLTLKSQNEGWKELIETTRFEILTECQVKINSEAYRRLEDSLNRWLAVTVHFEGSFYDQRDYLSLNFHVIDKWEIDKKNKKLKVQFSADWLLYQKKTNFFQRLDFDDVIALRSPLTVRIYEFLIKSFHGRNSWEIDAVKFAQKIPMGKQYPADIVPRVKSAVNRINEKTKFQIRLEVKRPKRGKAIFQFHRLKLTDDKEKKNTPKVLASRKFFGSLKAQADLF